MKDQIHALVVDDEEDIRFFLRETLEHAGYEVTTANNGEAALERLHDASFDLIMLDLNLGGRVDGIRVLETAKWRWPEIIVIILTAHGTMDSALAAINEGVDGYLLKPVTPGDIREAIRVALKRRKKVTDKLGVKKVENILFYGELKVDLKKYSASLSGEVLDLTPSEFRLLAYLMEDTERVSTPAKLVRVVRDYEASSDKEARAIIKWYIHRLRHKLEDDPANPQYIVNVRGIGYSLGTE